MTTKATTFSKATVILEVSPDAKGKNVAKLAAEGLVRFYTQRANGTFRHWSYLAPGTPERAEAEAVAAECASAKLHEVAAKRHVSLSTLRRARFNLDISQEAEAGTYNGTI